MKLVPDWRKAWQWFSVQAFAALIALPLVWPTLPPQVTGWVPDSWKPWVVVLIAAAGIFGRVVDQNKPDA